MSRIIIVKPSSGVAWGFLLLCLLVMTGCGGTASVLPDIPPTTDTRRSVLALALEQLGAPFQPGAAGPKTFDNSGLIYFAYQGADAVLPRTVGAQLNAGKPIELVDARPADLLFFRVQAADGSDLLRVGLYIRPGKMLMATPGVRDEAGVRLIGFEEPYWRQRMVGVIRPLP